LWGERSYRGGITGGDGKLTSDWRSLFERYSDRFLLGSDTWMNERWFYYDTIFKEYRNWLAPISSSRRAASRAKMRCGCLDYRHATDALKRRDHELFSR